VRTVPRVLPGVLAAVLLLGGCTVPTMTVSFPTPTRTPTDKAVAEACSALGSAFSKAGTTLNTALQQMGTDPQKALQTVQPLVDDLQTAVTKVDNPTVRAQGEKTVAALQELVTALDAAVKDTSKVPGLAAPFGKVQTELTAFATLCGG
jgi:Flp pilus assembly protein TadB